MTDETIGESYVHRLARQKENVPVTITDNELANAGWEYSGITMHGRTYWKGFMMYKPDANTIVIHDDELDITPEEFKSKYLNA